jgi:hypothetical protein
MFPIRADAKHSPKRAATIAARPREVKQDFETARSNPTAAAGFYSGLEMRKRNMKPHASFVPAKNIDCENQEKCSCINLADANCPAFSPITYTQNRLSRLDAKDCHPSLRGDVRPSDDVCRSR